MDLEYEDGYSCPYCGSNALIHINTFLSVFTDEDTAVCGDCNYKGVVWDFNEEYR